MRYSKKIMLDYLNGEAFEEKKLEKLENDLNFMKNAISYVKDKKLYKLCSKELKSNIEFIYFLIETFNNDLDFIIDVYNDYTNSNNKDEITNLELNIVATELFRKKIKRNNLKHRDFLIKCALYVEVAYTKEMCTYEVLKQEDKKMESLIGMGFELLKITYEGSTIILDYFSKKIIDEIFTNQVDLEEYLHDIIKNVSIIEKIGKKKFILEFLKLYDNSLSDYIHSHSYLFDYIEPIFDKVYDNWENYEIIKKTLVVESIIDEANNYLYQKGNLNISSEEFIYLVSKEYKMEECFQILIDHYNQREEEMYECFDKNYEINEFNKNLEKKDLSISELILYKDVSKIFERAIKTGTAYIDNYITDNEETEKFDSKILKFMPRKKAKTV